MHDAFIVYLEITISFLILCEGETKTLEILTPVIILFLCLCDACDERGNFDGCRYACFLSIADVGLFYRS